MAKRLFELIFPATLIKEPVIYGMARTVDVIFNIRRAKVTNKVGEIILELEAASDEALNDAVQFLTQRGVDVEPITHTTVES